MMFLDAQQAQMAMGAWVGMRRLERLVQYVLDLMAGMMAMFLLISFLWPLHRARVPPVTWEQWRMPLLLPAPLRDVRGCPPLLPLPHLSGGMERHSCSRLPGWAPCPPALPRGAGGPGGWVPGSWRAPLPPPR